jgi:general secretion pathway protein G
MNGTASMTPQTSPGIAAPRAARGFSLIEILVVMGLIGIVIALVASRVGDAAVRGRVNATKIAIDSLGGKLETYALDTGTYPQQLGDLLTKPADADDWAGPYAKEADLKDPWKHPFVYRYPGDKGENFDLYSYGPDGKEGGEGLKAADIGNW